MKLAEKLKRFNRLRDAQRKARKRGGVVSLARELGIRYGKSQRERNASIELGAIPQFTNYTFRYDPNMKWPTTEEVRAAIARTKFIKPLSTPS